MIELKRDINTLPVTWAGRILYRLLPAHKCRAKKNIELVFHDSLSASEKKHLARAYYSHMMTSMKDIIVFGWRSKRSLAKRVNIEGLEHLHQAISKDKGVIVFTGHFGSWEFAPLFFPEKSGLARSSLFCIRNSLRFDFLDKLFIRRYIDAGFEIINKKNALVHVCAALRKKGVVFFPFDLRPPQEVKKTVTTQFLGQNSLTYTSLADVVLKFKVPVLSISFYRLNKKQHVLQFYPEIAWQDHPDRTQAIYQNTMRYNQRLEDMLMLHPEQWLWSYKRWL